MLKKLLVWIAVLLIAALLAVPALAQEEMSASAGGLSVSPGVSAFEAGGADSAFTQSICKALKEDPVVWQQNLDMDPGLADICP